MTLVRERAARVSNRFTHFTHEVTQDAHMIALDMDHKPGGPHLLIALVENPLVGPILQQSGIKSHKLTADMYQRFSGYPKHNAGGRPSDWREIIEQSGELADLHNRPEIMTADLLEAIAEVGGAGLSLLSNQGFGLSQLRQKQILERMIRAENPYLQSERAARMQLKLPWQQF